MEYRLPPFDMTSARDILTILFKHKYKILATLLIISIGVALYAFTQEKKYEAQSVLLVKLGREFTPQPEVGSAGGSPAVKLETIINAETSLLASRDLIGSVVKTIGPEKIFPFLVKNSPGTVSPEEEAVQWLREGLSITNTFGSNLIEVGYTHHDPYMAARVVNTLVDAFKEKHLEVFSRDSTPFLESQQKSFQDRLKESEANLANFKQKSGVFSFEEQKAALIQQKNELSKDLKTAQSQIGELGQKVSAIRNPRWIAQAPPEVQTQLSRLQQQEQEVLSKYAEGTVPVQNVRKEIQAVKDFMKSYSEEVRQTELQKTEGELAMAKARVETIQRQLGQVEKELQSLEARALELQNLKREATQHEQNYQTYSRKFEESLVMDDMDRRKMVAITVVEKAVASSMPKKGRFGPLKLIAIGLCGGLGAGLALALILELISPGMTTPWSAERRLLLPVMAAIRKLNLTSQLPVDVNPKTDSAESTMEMEQEMVDLYQTITAALPDTDHRTVLFVGSRSNEGTSTIARQLARFASLRMEKSVLLIDLDRSRPDLHVYSNLKPAIDPQDTLELGGQIETTAHRVEESSFYVMPLFQGTMITPKTLDYANRVDFWEPLRNRFDLIIVDAPPVTKFPDGPAMVSRVDGVILVVEAEKTRWHVAESVKEKILKSGGNILGIVFNKRQFYIPEVIYRYL